VSGGFVASALAAGALLAVAGHHAGAGARAKPGNAAAQAIAYAQAQLGKPYLWGATGPGAFDCSGLVMQAYAAARVSIARTSQAQWATEQQVSTPQPGDLVFFPGADGTPASPGHVGIVVDPARHVMIDAYANGFPVEYDTYGPGASKQGLSDPVGFTDPARGS
jgi:cell wall-associated NlpC family hydrolase